MSENQEQEILTATSLEEAVAQAKRAFALKKFEQAVDYYATALEIKTNETGEDDPEVADLYYSYGRALLENAVSQSAVLGKEEAEEALIKDSPEAGTSKAQGAPFLSFSGDGDEETDEEVGPDEDTPVDLFAQARTQEEEEEREAQEDADDDGEPEDDFNAAWEVLDLARALYSKQKDDDISKMKLADTYIALGDVSLETEKFDQAITDYASGLTLKKQLLPLSSRQIAEAHYKLSIVLDLTSGKLAKAIEHAEKALSSVEARLAELRNAMSGQILAPSPGDVEDPKGKGKERTVHFFENEPVQNMTRTQFESEIKELDELRKDLALKVEELKSSPSGDVEGLSAPQIAAKALDKELDAPASTMRSLSSGPVNDLTSMVVKRKKRPTEMDSGESNGAGKRKATDEVSSEAKKLKL